MDTTADRNAYGHATNARLQGISCKLLALQNQAAVLPKTGSENYVSGRMACQMPRLGPPIGIRHNLYKMKSFNDRLIRLIAVFKFFKAGLLIALGVGAFNLMHRDLGDVVQHWVEALRLD